MAIYSRSIRLPYIPYSYHNFWRGKFGEFDETNVIH